MKAFMDADFILQTETAKKLYHEHASKMPIYDYHCHLPPQQIAEDKQFKNLTQIWLQEDHYKWRAMRSNGIDEKYCTGSTSDFEKFQKWAQTVPYTIRNPLYHWTHMELKKTFGIDALLCPDTAEEIYEACSEMLNSSEYSCKNLMRKANVKVVCTTDDPTDSLEHHRKIASDSFEIKVLPTWRPDKAMATDNIPALNKWIDKLSQITNIDIKDYDSYITAIKNRHDFFHESGCRISDHGIDVFVFQDYTEQEIKAIFDKIRTSQKIKCEEKIKFRSAMIYEFAIMNHQKNWAQQIHIGALRNNNSRLFSLLGPDAGFDSINDRSFAVDLSRFLNKLDSRNQLAKTVLYNNNPKDNEVLASMIGNFQDGSIPGKMQFGSAWWFLDQKDGMERQIEALSNLGLLSRFIGMTTDSRSFLSYSRHEYFRRILCNIVGNDVEQGLIPNEEELLGQIIEDISFNNAKNYFDIQL